MKISHVALIIITAITLSCKKTAVEKTVYINNDSIKGSVISDTIVYDVILRGDKKLSYPSNCAEYLNIPIFNSGDFLDSIFNSIYTNKITALDFFTGKAMSIKEVEKIEKADWFSKNSLGKIQFVEIWSFDYTHMVMNKKILSLVFGVENINEKGEFRGYKPLFRIQLN